MSADVALTPLADAERELSAPPALRSDERLEAASWRINLADGTITAHVAGRVPLAQTSRAMTLAKSRPPTGRPF